MSRNISVCTINRLCSDKIYTHCLETFPAPALFFVLFSSVTPLPLPPVPPYQPKKKRMVFHLEEAVILTTRKKTVTVLDLPPFSTAACVLQPFAEVKKLHSIHTRENTANGYVHCCGACSSSGIKQWTKIAAFVTLTTSQQWGIDTANSIMHYCWACSDSDLSKPWT